ncbi:MAG: C_GCAxxG_C_C family protein [Clostridia bacterium]|nr:C_GCAxxG_C_C family protein [Clostridia bacterium]
MTHSEKAAQFFSEGYNCSQSVVLAYCDELKLDKELALRLSSSFGGGMGRLREVCGAVSGMFMVAGILHGYSEPTDKAAKDNHYKLIQELATEFKNKHSSYICKELLRVSGKESHISSPRTAEYYKTRPCVKFVITACEILDKHFFN